MADYISDDFHPQLLSPDEIRIDMRLENGVWVAWTTYLAMHLSPQSRPAKFGPANVWFDAFQHAVTVIAKSRADAGVTALAWPPVDAFAGLETPDDHPIRPLLP